jgi:hypothetical protein
MKLGWETKVLRGSFIASRHSQGSYVEAEHRNVSEGVL